MTTTEAMSSPFTFDPNRITAMDPANEDAYKTNLLLQKPFGYGWLEENGFINIENARVENGFTKDKAKSTGNATSEDPEQPLHPAVRMDRWQHITPRHWTAIHDALLLFSRILDDPLTLPFLKGLLSNGKHMPIDRHTARHALQERVLRGDLVSFQPENAVPPNDSGLDEDEELKAGWKYLRDMAKCVKWRFGGNGDDSVAETEPTADWTGVPKMFRLKGEEKAAGAVIRLSEAFLKVLLGELKPKDPSFAYPQHDIDEKSALLRTKLYLVETMLHEYAHAVWMIHSVKYIPPATDPSHPGGAFISIEEPYFRDQRKNELGFAFSQYLFHGSMLPIGPDTPAVPYGLSTIKWPLAWDAYQQKGVYPLASGFKWGTIWTTYYGIPMDWVQAVFTKRFWRREVLARGMLAALKPPRDVGIRQYVTEGDEGESPTKPVKAAGDPDSSDDEGLDRASGIIARRRFRVKYGRVEKMSRVHSWLHRMRTKAQNRSVAVSSRE